MLAVVPVAVPVVSNHARHYRRPQALVPSIVHAEFLSTTDALLRLLEKRCDCAVAIIPADDFTTIEAFHVHGCPELQQFQGGAT